MIALIMRSESRACPVFSMNECMCMPPRRRYSAAGAARMQATLRLRLAGGRCTISMRVTPEEWAAGALSEDKLATLVSEFDE